VDASTLTYASWVALTRITFYATVIALVIGSFLPANSQGRWLRPDRHVSRLNPAQLLDWACTERKVDKDTCEKLKAEVGDGKTEAQMLAALELAWLAR
jgi:hypothetical protein